MNFTAIRGRFVLGTARVKELVCMCSDSAALIVLGSTVVSPYVGMARKQNGGYNASTSVQTPLVHLVANCTHPKTVRSAL